MDDKEIRGKILEILLGKYLENPLDYYNYQNLPGEIGCDIDTANRNAQFLIDEGLIKDRPEKGHHPYLTGRIRLTAWGFEESLESKEELRRDFEDKKKIILKLLYEKWTQDSFGLIKLSEIKEGTILNVNEVNFSLHYLNAIGYVGLEGGTGCAPYIAHYAKIDHEGVKWIEEN